MGVLLLLLLPVVASATCCILTYRWINRFHKAADAALEVLDRVSPGFSTSGAGQLSARCTAARLLPPNTLALPYWRCI